MWPRLISRGRQFPFPFTCHGALKTASDVRVKAGHMQEQRFAK